MAKTDWKEANGRVVKIDSIYPRGRRQLIVTLSYEVGGQLYESELYTFKSMHQGDLLTVRYDASNPELTEFQSKYKRNWLIWSAVMATFFIGALMILLWIRAARH